MNGVMIEGVTLQMLACQIAGEKAVTKGLSYE